MRKRMKRALAFLLTAVMLITALPTQVFAYMANKDTEITFIDKDGNTVTEEASWEEAFPYGTFAFDNSQLTIAEGEGEGVIRLYRLGGTTGRAEAYVTYVPPVAEMADGSTTYANAAGAGDVRIWVEDPLPIAQYQPLGRDPDPLEAETPAQVTSRPAGEESTGEEASGESDLSLLAGEGEIQAGDLVLTLDQAAEAWQWQVLYGGAWEDISGGTEDFLLVNETDLETYDFRCIYTVDGQQYGSTSLKGEAYTCQEETLPEMPDDLDLNPESTYSELPMDPENPYEGWIFSVVFADGEWVKEIHVSAPEDDQAEPDKFGLFTISDCLGGSLYDTANTLTLHVTDNDEAGESTVGFAVTSVEVDKAENVARITVSRTGDTTQLVTVDYETMDGTAVAGTDYLSASGTLIFYADITEQTIEIPLVDDQVASEERLEFQVVLSGLKGAEDKCTLSNDTITIRLWNSGTGDGGNLASLLQDGEAADVSGGVASSGGSVAPVGVDSVTGTQVAQEAVEPVPATIVYGSAGDVSPLSHDYSGTLVFNRSNYGTGQYWDRRVRIFGNPSTSEYNDFGKDGIFGNWSNGSAFSSLSNVSGTQTVSIQDQYIGQKFSSINLGIADKGTDSSTTGTATLRGTNGTSNTTYKDTLTEGTGTALFQLSTGSTALSSVASFSYDQLSLSTTKGTYSLSYAYLQRRAVGNNLGLKIHTANDSDTKDPNAALIEDTLYDAMKPSVTIVPAAGGVNKDNNKLFVGSRLQVDVSSLGGFAIADNGVYFTDANGNRMGAAASRVDDDTWTIDLVWNGIDLNGQYTLNVEITRKQDVSLDISASVDRVEGSTSMDASKIGEGWTRFWNSAANSGNNVITVGTSRSASDGTIEEKTYSQSQWTSTTSAAVSQVGLQNLQWINFNRSPEDYIVFNGRLYAGNAQIWLQQSDLSLGTLNVQYYHKDFLSTVSPMKVNLNGASLYLDANGNGQIDGHYDSKAGVFVLDTDADGNTIDQFLFRLEEGEEYNSQIFAPVPVEWDEDGNPTKYAQYFLKVDYAITARCLFPTPDMDANAKAQVLPAFVTNITDPTNYAALTEEQRAYRYIISGKNQVDSGGYTRSGDSLAMYGAEASLPAQIDIPLGGDTSPARLSDDGQSIVWEPNYQGNLLYPFSNPEPIYIENSVAGSDIPIANLTSYDAATDTFTYESSHGRTGVDLLNGFLGSFNANTAYTLCVQEQVMTIDAIAAANGVEIGGGDLALLSDPAPQPEPEGSSVADIKTVPDAEYLKVLEPGDVDTGTLDMSDSPNEFPEFNLDMSIDLPSSDIAATDFVTITIDGNQVGFSIGLPIGGYNSNGDAGTAGVGNASGNNKGSWNSPAETYKGAGEDFANLWNWIRHPSMDTFKENSDSYQSATSNTNRKLSAHGFSAEFGVSMAFVFEYNALDNDFYFQQFAVAASAGLEFTVQFRFSPFPIAYVYLTASIGAEIGVAGVSVERLSETGDELLSANQQEVGQAFNKGTTMLFNNFSYKSFDIQFKGKILVEAFTDASCSTKYPDSQSGYLQSGETSETVTVTMLQQDGQKLDTPMYLRITSLEDGTTVSSVKPVTSVRTETSWDGFTFSPEAFAEAGIGIGIEILKLEAYFKINIGCSMAFAKEVDNAIEGFNFEEFEFGLSAGLRVVLLLFTYELDIISYTVSYEQGEGWSHSWSALNGAASGGAELSATDSSGNTYPVRIKLPGSTVDTQTIYQPGQSGDLDPLAIDPPNGADVPFQLSGYGSSADAFKLADGLITGYDYQVVTVGSDNYVIYTISRSGAASSLDNSMLVLSKLQLTGSGADAAYGLVNPADSSASTPYIPLDNDAAGDLDFNAWADDSGAIHAAWVSYASPNGSTSDDIQQVQTEAAKNTVVKTASYTPGQDSFSTPTVVSGAAGSHVFLPNVLDGSVAVYGKAVHYTEEELAAATTDYKTFLRTAGYDPDDTQPAAAQIGQYRLAYQQGLWNVYGKGSQLLVSVDGKEAAVQLSEGQILDNLEAVKIGDTYYVAYTTSQMQYMDGNTVAEAADATDVVTIKRLFLRTFTVDGDGTVTWTDHDTEKEGTQALLLRTLYDYETDSTQDGLYTGGTLKGYQDPYFANLQFLNAELGELKGTPEDFETMSAGQSEDFLLFEMNGSTYVVPQADLESIVTSHSGRIIPFFTPAAIENENGGTTVQSSTGRSEVTIGADGAGNLAAVYVGTVPGTSGNALYLTRYDPATTTWGAGTMLAMEHMQVHEDAITYGLTYEETENAHLGKATGNEAYDAYIADAGDSAKGSMDYFTFSNLQIALGQSSEGSETLLVLTQGNLRYLKEVEIEDGETVLAPMNDEEAQAAYEAARSPANRKPGMGVYAVSYGMGQQKLGEAELGFGIYDFTAGSELETYVSFVNGGDVALRASEANPLTVELNVSGMGTPLATWEITENVLAGQKVELSGVCAALTADLTKGAEFSITVKEDASYFSDPANLTSGSLLTVADKVELGFESFTARITGVDENGNAQLYVDTQISNRGSTEAQGVYLQFSYEDADGSYKPLDLTGNTLQVSTSQDLDTLAASSLTSGILALQGSDGQNLATGKYRTLTGTIPVSSSAFADGLTGSLNLRVEIFSDNGSTVSSNVGIVEADHNEYNTGNNVRLAQVAPATFFTSATRVTMPLGTTMRLPVSISTTTGTAPSIVVVETAKDGEANHLGALYYQNGSFANGSETGTLVLSPISEGSGIVHLQDLSTNTTYAITYTVGQTGDGINIFNDTDLFTFNGYDPEATGDNRLWKFETGIPTWGATDAEIPLNSDLAYGKVGQTFTFETQAESIQLYFAGKVKVSSDFPGFDAVEVSASGGKNGFAEIKFGDNQTNYTHTVTVEILEGQYPGDSYAAFDRVIMTYGSGGTPVPTPDADAPHLYWSRSFPETASVQDGEPVKLTLYVLDDNGVASVTVNGQRPTGMTGSGQFLTVPVTVTENGTLTVVATDLSGKSTQQKIQVDWFHAQPDADASAYAPGLTDVSIDGQNNIVYTATPSANAEGTNPTVTITQIVTGADGLVEGTLSGPTVTANGWYLVTATDAAPNDDQWSAQMVYMGSIAAAGPIATLTYELNPTGGATLKWTARTESSGTSAAPTITSVKLNGTEQSIESGKTSLSGTMSVTYGGTYELEVRDSSNGTGTAKLEVTVPIYVRDGETLFTVTNATDVPDGKVAVNTGALLGGKMPGSYEWRLVPADSRATLAELLAENDQWSNTDLTGLSVGDYTLYIRDANDPANASVVLSRTLTVGSEKITVNATQKTAATGADIAWSAEKAYGAQEKITAVSINDLPLTVTTPDFRLSGTWHTTHAGDYVIEATDAKGTSGKFTLTVQDVPIYLTEGGTLFTVTNATNDAGDNGKVTIDPTVLLGGKYDTTLSDPANNRYKGSYEWRLVKDEDASTLAVLLSEDEAWGTETELTGLAPGQYTLYVRDANDTRNEDTVLALQLQLTVTVGDERITVTLKNTGSALEWTATKGANAREPITSVTINGRKVNTESGMSLSGSVPIAFGGTYTLVAQDSGATQVSAKREITVADFPVTISDEEGLVTVQNPWNQAGDNGVITVNGVDRVTGGLFDASLSTPDQGIYKGSYEWRMEPSFAFDRTKRLEELKAQWLKDHPDAKEIPSDVLAGFETQVDNEALEAKAQWLTGLLADADGWNALSATDAHVLQGQTAGSYTLLIRDAQEQTNEKTVYIRSVTLENERISITAEAQSASSGQDNGAVTVNAQGGYLGQHTYQFIIRPITGEEETVDIRDMDSALDREQFPEEQYSQPKWDVPDFTVFTDPDEITDTSYSVLNTATLSNLPSGWYQVGVRPMLGVSDAELLQLARLAAAYTAAGTAAIEAADNATEAGIARQVTQRTSELSQALNTWRNAAAAEAADAEAAYKALINSDADVLAALDAWKAENFATGALQSAYDAAVKAYFTERVTNESAQAAQDTSEALEDAKAAYEAEYARLMQVAQTAYDGASGDIGWGNGVTMVIYVSRTASSSSDQILVRDLRYPDDETVTVQFTDRRRTLSTAAEKQLIADNAERDIIATSSVMEARIPAGTLEPGDDLMAMLMPFAKLPSDTTGTVVQCTTADGACYRVPWSVVTLGKVWYIASEPGTYTLVTVPVSFADVTEDFWGYDEVCFVAARDLFQGVGDDEFAPNGTMTRAMLVTVLGRLAGIDPADYTGKRVFSDVDPDTWYGPYVAWASENGVVEGVGGGRFAPNAPITREQLCTMLARYLQDNGIDLPVLENPASFTDQAQISAWAADAVEQFRLSGIIEGFNGRFLPGDDASRAEVAAILARLITAHLTNT